MANEKKIDTQGTLGNELSYLLNEARGLRIISSPNVNPHQTTTGTALGLKAQPTSQQAEASGGGSGGSGTLLENDATGTKRWFTLKPYYTGAVEGYRSPFSWDSSYDFGPSLHTNGLAGGGGGLNRDHCGNRQALVLHALWERWSMGSGFSFNAWYTQSGGIGLLNTYPFVQLQEVPHLAAFKDENDVEHYEWIAPPPIPLSALHPMMDSDPVGTWANSTHGNWLGLLGVPYPYYKYGNTIDACTRWGWHTNSIIPNYGTWEGVQVGYDFQQWENDPNNPLDIIYDLDASWANATVNRSLYYPCWNELLGNGYIDFDRDTHNTIYGWDYWSIATSGGMGASIGGHVSDAYPVEPIKAIKLKEPLYFGSQNHPNEVIECWWMDTNVLGRSWWLSQGFFNPKWWEHSWGLQWFSYVVGHMPTYGSSDPAPFGQYYNYQTVAQSQDYNAPDEVDCFVSSYNPQWWADSFTYNRANLAQSVGTDFWIGNGNQVSEGVTGFGNLRRGINHNVMSGDIS